MVRSLWEEGLPITKLDIKFFDKSVTPLLAHDPGPVPSASYLAILLPAAASVSRSGRYRDGDKWSSSRPSAGRWCWHLVGNCHTSTTEPPPQLVISTIYNQTHIHSAFTVHWSFIATVTAKIEIRGWYFHQLRIIGAAIMLVDGDQFSAKSTRNLLLIWILNSNLHFYRE